jgi:capsular exopolysaccharide synthesis family protein
MNINSTVSVNTGTAVSMDGTHFFANEMRLMTSPDIIERAIALANEQKPEKYGGVHGNPSVTPNVELITGTTIFQLTAQGADPDYTQLFLESWMQTYLDVRKERRQATYNTATMRFDQEAEKYKQAVSDLRDEEDKYIIAHNYTSKQAAQDAANEDATKLRGIKDQEKEVDAQLKILETLPDPDPNTDQFDPLAKGTIFEQYVNGNDGEGQLVEEIDREIEDNKLLPAAPSYQKLKQDYLNLQASYAQLGVGLGRKHPKMMVLEQQVKQAKENLLVLRSQRVAELESVKASLKTAKATLVKNEKDWQDTNIADTELARNIEDYDLRIQDNRTIYVGLVQNTNSLNESKDIGAELMNINLHATPATEYLEPPMKQIAQGAFVGLAAGMLIIFLLGALDGRVMSVEDLSQRFEEPMLGVIPMQKRLNGQVELLKHSDQRQMFAESCRNIRSSLLYMDRQGQRPRVIMLTSSMPSEGKSTLSSNLAITLGFAASRTLLVDADMRRGQLYKRFGLKNDVGLAEHIADGLPLESVIQHTQSENLDFISCGKYPTQPGELLMSDRFRESIQTLRQRYDFVVFDSPPILLTDDAASFATRADAVIFVVRAGFTRLRQVRASMENLHRRGVNVYGMVVNFIDHREPGYYSYRYYDYYSYRPERPERPERKDRSA